jgi:hypothetical protein
MPKKKVDANSIYEKLMSLSFDQDDPLMREHAAMIFLVSAVKVLDSIGDRLSDDQVNAIAAKSDKASMVVDQSIKELEESIGIVDDSHHA